MQEETQINEDKIKIMAKLAVYDKKYGESDRKANGLYYRDYVYRKNFFLRFFALIGTLMPVGLYLIMLLMNDTLDLLTFDYMGVLINVFLIIAAVMIFYTFIGTQIATQEYKEIKVRLKSYFGMLKELDKLTEKQNIDELDDETLTPLERNYYESRNRERERLREERQRGTTTRDRNYERDILQRVGSHIDSDSNSVDTRLKRIRGEQTNNVRTTRKFD